MSKPVDNTKFERLVATSRCTIVEYREPRSQHSRVVMKCFCGCEFTNTRHNIKTALLRPARTIGEFSCGCADKKWSNAKLDELLGPRQIQRLTNCDVPGLQPSVMKLDWRCLKCNHEWRVAVDSIANKNVGCPRCAGNTAYTPESLQQRLAEKGRTDLTVLGITPGHTKRSAYGQFQCVACKGVWSADLHNVLKFRYGCPPCNDNISSRVYTSGGTFHSKLEHYFWEQYFRVVGNRDGLRRQVRYSDTRRFTCDFVLPDDKTWVEIAGKRMLSLSKYTQTIATKRQICEDKNRTFVLLTSFTEINNFLQPLGIPQ